MKRRRKARASRLGWWGAGCGLSGVGGLLAIVLGIGLFYFGWCWGWWGKNNLLLQYNFQCRCPAASEEVRYKPFKVIASACTYPFLRGFSPSGRYMILFEHPQQRVILLDLATGETLDIGSRKGDPGFLTDNLVLTFGDYPKPRYFLIDLTDRSEMEVLRVESWDSAANCCERSREANLR